MVKLIKGVNDLATVNPELAKQWHPTKNGMLTPQMVTAHSGQKVWWICPLGHAWETRIADRTRGYGCPFCSGHKVLSGFNDLATVNPELVKQWHPTKNGDLKPTTVLPFSNEKVWWICPLGHEWQATIANRSNGSNCPICAGKQVLIGYNDLTTTNPELASQWHPTKNGDKIPTMFSKGSHEKVWWICPFGHEWRAGINSRLSGVNCPTCASELQTSFPEQAIYYYLTQIDDTVENRKKINDKVEVDIWIPSKNTAIEYDGWYYHNGEKSDLLEQKKNDYLKTLGVQLIRVKELENVDVERYDKNIITTLYCIRSDTSQLNKVIEKLTLMLFDNITLKIDVKQDECKILQLYKQDCVNNSLGNVNPKLASEWHPTKNGTLTPQMFARWSSVKVCWICPKGHEWQARIADRSKGDGCPICSGHQVLIGYNDLTTTHPQLAKEWHPTKNGIKTPKMFSRGSREKICWVCPLGHEWCATINSRSRGGGCPTCSKINRRKNKS